MVRARLISLTFLSLAGALAACGSARDVAEGAGPIHPAGFLDVHPARALADLGSCRGCHGTDFGGALGPSCNACHEDAGFASWQSNCTFCHGQERVATFTLADLPKAAPATGAHVKHAGGGVFTAPISCEQCHPAVTSLDHVDGTATIAFGSVATAGGLTPTWSGGTCSSVYCHGSTLSNPATPNPAWSGGSLVCGSCHDLAPTSGQHVFHRTAPRNAACFDCHRGFGTIDLEHHVNGTSEAVIADGTTFSTFEEPDCTNCHAALGVEIP